MLALGITMLGACHDTDITKHHHHKESDMSSTVEEHHHIEIETDTIVSSPFRRVITVSGELEVNPSSDITIVANISGVVTLPSWMAVGVKIEREDIVATLNSNNIQNGDPIQLAEIRYLAAKEELDRVEPLMEERIVSARTYNAVHQEFESAKVAYEAVCTNSMNEGGRLTAPSTGYIKSILVENGSYVEAGSPIAVVTQSSILNLRADIPEHYYSQINNIETAHFTTQYNDRLYQLEHMEGRIISYGNGSIDNYIPMLFSLKNDNTLLPGSFVRVYLISSVMDNSISIPIEAIIEEQGQHSVYVVEGRDIYHKHPITIGLTDGERIEILQGLSEGDVVVTKGAMQIKLASTQSSLPAHSHSH